ncbi:hypothetical protein ISCGN_001120 [Ixodes scapularis]
MSSASSTVFYYESISDELDANSAPFQLVQNRKKRKASTSSESSDKTVKTMNHTDPHLTVIVRPKDPDKLIATINPKKIQEKLDMAAPDGVIVVRPNRRLNVLAIDIRNRDATKALLALTTLDGIALLAYEPLPRESAAGVIYEVPADLTEVELQLAVRTTEPVISIRRLGKSETVKLVFSTDTVPERGGFASCFPAFGKGTRPGDRKRDRTCVGDFSDASPVLALRNPASDQCVLLLPSSVISRTDSAYSVAVPIIIPSSSNAAADLPLVTIASGAPTSSTLAEPAIKAAVEQRRASGHGSIDTNMRLNPLLFFVQASLCNAVLELDTEGTNAAQLRGPQQPSYVPDGRLRPVGAPTRLAGETPPAPNIEPSPPGKRLGHPRFQQHQKCGGE